MARIKGRVTIVLIILMTVIFIGGCQSQDVVTGGGEGWEVVAPIGKHVYGMTTAVLDGKVHLLGGVHGGDWTDPIDFHQVYDPATDSWSMLAAIPDPRGGIGWGMSAIYDGKIYLFGGGSGPDLEGSKRVWVYDPAIDEWSQLSDMPVERINGSAVTADDFIYIFGGHRLHVPPADELISTYRYDPLTDSYERMANMPERGSFITRAYYNGNIYAITGVEQEWLGGDEFFYIYGQGVLKYDVAANRWTKLDVPRIRQRTYTLTQLSTDVTDGSRLFVLGGKPPESSRTNLAAYFDMETEKFGQIGALPKGRCCGSAAVIDGKIYVAGGFWERIEDVYNCEETWSYNLSEEK